MALIHAEPRPAARASAPVREPSVPRRRCPALVASTVGPGRAHALLGRLPLAAVGDVPLRPQHRRYRRAGRNDSLPGRAPGQSRGRLLLRSSRPVRRRPGCTITACGPLSEDSRFGEHGLPLIGSGDWNDGMNLVGSTARARASGWPSSCVRCSSSSPRLRACAATMDSPNAASRGGSAARRASKRTAGTASGIAAPTSTTARRSARRATPNARSIRSRRAGRFSRCGRRQTRRAWQWTRSTNAWFAGTMRLIQLLDPPFDKSDLNPGYIKGYVPGVRENGGQYTHGASGRSWRSPHWATTDARGNCSP